MTAVPPRPAAPIVVHASPPGTSAAMPCCGRTPFQVPRTDRMTLNPAHVTCRPAAPDATAGDELREAELVARIAEAIQDHRDAATGPTTPEQDYRPGAPCMSCGGYPGPLHQRSDCPRAVARAILPALRDVPTAAARDAEKVRRVEQLADALGAEAMRQPTIERATASLRVYRALGGAT